MTSLTRYGMELLTSLSCPLALLSADRLLSFEGEARLKASHARLNESGDSLLFGQLVHVCKIPDGVYRRERFLAGKAAESSVLS
ncbi:hypothetical protein KY290_025750 [Solanum tuberosum]|uniref:Uncharacterized protein n=1 Tax=Solanum tuberosum TaxID=4113 RepID=A0ABQ7UUH7_SOLTU|nr:hypothetical protein KY289_024808 [Solanum tuberosum]KAH0676777.1 hypothetical protein KY285_024578 [Solanum tuberosum]KAH0755480.1 hypothetical protein KY290_025750 [Solanum tuberosum]